MAPSSPPLSSGTGRDQDPNGDVASGGSHRDALVRRLKSLAEKLTQEGSRADSDDERLGTLNAIVDQMEMAFSDHDHHPGEGADTPRQTGLHPANANGDAGDVLKKPQMPGRSVSDWLGPLSPFELSAMPVHMGTDVRSRPRHDNDHNDDDKHSRNMTHEDAERVAAEAQNLCRELDTVMASLKARQEESEVSPTAQPHLAGSLNSDNVTAYPRPTHYESGACRSAHCVSGEADPRTVSTDWSLPPLALPLSQCTKRIFSGLTPETPGK